MDLMAAGVSVLQKRHFSLVVATCASLLLHGVLVAELLNIYSPGNNSAAAAPARLQVYVLAPVAPPHAPDIPAAQPVRRENEQRPPRLTATRKIDRAPTPDRSPPPPTALVPITEAPAEPAMVLPFTPPIASPLGRGSWGMTMPPQINPQHGQFRIEQARAQFRAQLMDRLSSWVARQAQQRKEVSCLIRMGLDTRQATLSCIPIEAEAELWSVLVGLATTGAVNEADVACLRVGTDQLGMVACDDKSGP